MTAFNAAALAGFVAGLALGGPVVGIAGLMLGVLALGLVEMMRGDVL